MSRPAVFFDRDNTLIVGNDYLGDPAGVVLVRGAAAAIAACHDLGFSVVTVSNQSGVARGMFSEHDVSLVNARMEEMLQSDNAKATIDRHEYCPHHPQGTTAGYAYDCECRKPKPGMILTATKAMDLDLPASWLVGDAPRDIAAGKAAGCRTILIVDPSLPASPAAAAKSEVTPDFVVASLSDAVDIIRKNPRDVPAVTQHETPVSPAVESAQAVAPAPPPASKRAESDTAVAKVDLSRLEMLNQQVLMELKKLNDIRHDDFSISKLVAGITQTLALAALPLAYVLYRTDAGVFQSWLLTAIFLQVFTIALLVMGRQR